MGSSTLKLVKAGNEYLSNTDTEDGDPHERLLHLRAEVEPDGSATSFGCCFTNGPAFKFLVPFAEMPPMLHTVRHASELMVNRSTLTQDGGNSRIVELCATALHPTETDILIDPLTGDRLVVLQFTDHAPVVIRRTAAEIEDVFKKLVGAVARSMNSWGILGFVLNFTPY